MPGPTVRTLRFVSTWRSDGRAVDEREVELRDGGERLRATLLRPRDAETAASWIVLHGVTRPGRRHPQLVRFARALAASGARVLVPEIREWTELRLAPDRTVPVVRASVAALATRDGGRGRPGLAGFSFGAPQALRAAAHPELRRRIGGVVGFGGYCDVERTFRFQLTGEHVWRERPERLRPDPYGRWVVAANYLTRVPGHADAEDVAAAVRRLAMESSERQIPADDPALVSLGRELRETVAPARRPLFDRMTAEPESVSDDGELVRLAADMAAAARRVAPELEVGSRLGALKCPVELIHGRQDRLIPASETLRLRKAFPSGASVNVLITGLFSHARQNPLRAGFATVREAWRFFRALRRVLAMV